MYISICIYRYRDRERKIDNVYINVDGERERENFCDEIF